MSTNSKLTFYTLTLVLLVALCSSSTNRYIAPKFMGFIPKYTLITTTLFKNLSGIVIMLMSSTRNHLDLGMQASGLWHWVNFILPVSVIIYSLVTQSMKIIERSTIGGLLWCLLLCSLLAFSKENLIKALKKNMVLFAIKYYSLVSCFNIAFSQRIFKNLENFFKKLRTVQKLNRYTLTRLLLRAIRFKLYNLDISFYGSSLEQFWFNFSSDYVSNINKVLSNMDLGFYASSNFSFDLLLVLSFFSLMTLRNSFLSNSDLISNFFNPTDLFFKNNAYGKIQQIIKNNENNKDLSKFLKRTSFALYSQAFYLVSKSYLKQLNDFLVKRYDLKNIPTAKNHLFRRILFLKLLVRWFDKCFNLLANIISHSFYEPFYLTCLKDLLLAPITGVSSKLNSWKICLKKITEDFTDELGDMALLLLNDLAVANYKPNLIVVKHFVAMQRRILNYSKKLSSPIWSIFRIGLVIYNYQNPKEFLVNDLFSYALILPWLLKDGKSYAKNNKASKTCSSFLPVIKNYASTFLIFKLRDYTGYEYSVSPSLKGNLFLSLCTTGLKNYKKELGIIAKTLENQQIYIDPFVQKKEK